MKKIIIIICVFLLTGCYDNIEVDNLNIVEGIGIDFQNNSYVVTLEILNSSSDEEDSIKTFTITGEGDSISKAFVNASQKSEKVLNYAHLDIVLISEEIAETHLESIVDYLFRNNDIRDEFSLLVSLNSPEELLNNTSEVIKEASKYIKDLVDSEKYNNSMGVTDNFQDIMAKLISNKQDIILNSVSMVDDVISLNGAYIFHKYESVSTLTLEDITIYNMLTGNIVNGLFSKTYDEEDFVINITSSKSNIEVSSNKIKIDVQLYSEIIQNNPNFNLLDNEVYDMLNEDFSLLIRSNIKSFIKYLQKHNSDILGLQNIYYKKNNTYLNELWRVSDIEIDVNLEISTKGYIFEVENE